MKGKLILMCAVGIISLCLVACAPPQVPVSVDVSCDDFAASQNITKEVEIGVGESLTVTLCSNPTTGFEWSGAEIGDQTVLQQTEHKFVDPEGIGGEPPLTGAPGKELWTFKALKQGASNVSMEYGRPWEGGEKAVWTFVLTVDVK